MIVLIVYCWIYAKQNSGWIVLKIKLSVRSNLSKFEWKQKYDALKMLFSKKKSSKKSDSQTEIKLIKGREDKNTWRSLYSHIIFITVIFGNYIIQLRYFSFKCKYIYQIIQYYTCNYIILCLQKFYYRS